MTRQTLSNCDAFDLRFFSGKFEPLTQEINDTHSVSEEGPIGHFISASSPQDVILPPLDEGLFYFITNQGTADLTVKSFLGDTIAVLPPGVSSVFYSDGGEWSSLVPASSYTVFGPVGSEHSTGLVPDPGPTPAGERFLRDDGIWATPTGGGGGLANAYVNVTDGVNTAVGTGADTFKLRSADSALTILVTNNQVTHGDNALFTVVPGSINHDSLLNYDADEHVPHSTIDIVGGGGLAGGGSIDADRTIILGFSSLTAQAPVLTDQFAFLNVSTHFRGTLTQLNGILIHDNLNGFVAAEHVDHSAVSITGGTGLTGGGTINSSQVISMNIPGLGAISGFTAADLFVVYDDTGPAHTKATFLQLNQALDITVLTGYGGITTALAGKQPLDADLTAIAAFASTGIAVRTASDTWAQRSIAVAGTGLAVTNPAGIAGDPTVTINPELLMGVVPISSISGTANAITGVGTPTQTAYRTGWIYVFTPAQNNTTSATVNWNSIGVSTLKKNGSNLIADDILAGRTYGAMYDGTNMNLIFSSAGL